MAKKKIIDTKKEDHQSLLSRKCILIKMGIHTMNFWKKETSCEAIVKSTYNVKSEGNIRVHKQAMNKKYFDKIMKVKNKAIGYFYKNTSSYPHIGWQLLPVVIHDKVMSELRKLKEEFEIAYDEMRDNIQSYKDTMKGLLGDLYDETDYPSLSDMDRKFSFNIERSVVPNSGNLIADLASQEYDEIRNEVEAAAEHALEVAMQSAWDKLIKAIKRLRDQLMKDADTSASDQTFIQAKPPIIRDSLVGNIRELIDILPALNITENPDMHRVIGMLQIDIAPIDVETLRDDQEMRIDTAKKADDILRSLQGIYRV